MSIDQNKQKIFYFFPYYQIGGSERVHLEIVKCLKEYNNIVVFTDRSRDNKHKKEFYSLATCYNLFGINNKIRLVKKILLKIFSFIINRSPSAIVVGSNSRFFYELIPKLADNIKIIDIVHSLYGPTKSIALKSSCRVNNRVIITPATLAILKNEYKNEKVCSKHLSKIQLIENCVNVPECINKDFNGNLNVLYIGRNSEEKRPDLAVKVWEKMKENTNINFLFVGRGMNKYFAKVDREKLVIENIFNDAELDKIYRDFHIIYLVSRIEGFPMIFKEAMGYGVVPLSTSVGGVTDNIFDHKNGFLVNNGSNTEILSDVTAIINKLDSNRGLLKDVSANARKYAMENFTCNNFCVEYNKLINFTT